MTPDAVISLFISGGGLLVNVFAMAIGYGVLRGTVTALDKRVAAMEAETKTIKSLEVTMMRLETKIDALDSKASKIETTIDAIAPRRRSTT